MSRDRAERYQGLTLSVRQQQPATLCSSFTQIGIADMFFVIRRWREYFGHDKYSAEFS